MQSIYAVGVVALISLGLAGLVWATINFKHMAHLLGLFGYWSFAIPTTRLGMSCAMLAVALLGFASLPPALQFYQEHLRAVIRDVAIALAVVGLVHDFAWLLARRRSGA